MFHYRLSLSVEAQRHTAADKKEASKPQHWFCGSDPSCSQDLFSILSVPLFLSVFSSKTRPAFLEAGRLNLYSNVIDAKPLVQ
jgi:hypothetical protein